MLVYQSCNKRHILIFRRFRDFHHYNYLFVCSSFSLNTRFIIHRASINDFGASLLTGFCYSCFYNITYFNIFFFWLNTFPISHFLEAKLLYNSKCPSVRLSVCLSVCPSVHPSVCLSVFPSDRLSV